MDCFHKLGKTHLLLTLKLKGHSEIMIQVSLLCILLHILVLGKYFCKDQNIQFYVKLAVDVVEIGERRRNIGEVLKVKPLGALAMIDEGELDWKIVAISLDDPKASLVNDVDDVEKHFPVCVFSSHFICGFLQCFSRWEVRGA